MSRRNITYSGLLVVFIVFVISLVVKIKKGDSVLLANKEVLISERCNVWFPKLFGEEDRANYINHVGHYSELFVYIDSLSCSSCQIRHLYKWQQLAEQIEKEQGIKVLPIIVISPMKADTLRLKYDYMNSFPIMPVIIENEDFKISNPWLSNLKTISVFLLDEKRKVKNVYRL